MKAFSRLCSFCIDAWLIFSTYRIQWCQRALRWILSAANEGRARAKTKAIKPEQMENRRTKPSLNQSRAGKVAGPEHSGPCLQSGLRVRSSILGRALGISDYTGAKQRGTSRINRFFISNGSINKGSFHAERSVETCRPANQWFFDPRLRPLRDRN